MGPGGERRYTFVPESAAGAAVETDDGVGFFYPFAGDQDIADPGAGRKVPIQGAGPFDGWWDAIVSREEDGREDDEEAHQDRIPDKPKRFSLFLVID